MPRITTTQLRIAPSEESGFQKNLNDGIFSVLLGYHLPSTDRPFKLASEEGLAVCKQASKDKRISSLMLYEDPSCDLPYGMLEVAQEIRKSLRRKEIIAGISGRGLDKKELHELLIELAHIKLNGVVNDCGPALHDHPQNTKGIPESSTRYLDSPAMIWQANQTWPGGLHGAVINPYKYTLDDTYLQYYKMAKLINSGSNLIVTEYGWDPAKLHELQWYMQQRNIVEPVLAKILMLSPGDVSRVMNGDYPGLNMSRELGPRLQRLEQNPADFIRYELKHVGLQAAGCRLMGYSGIILGGCSDPELYSPMVDAVFESLETYSSWNDWVEAWQEFHQVANLNFSSPDQYYIYNPLMDQDFLDFDTEKVKVSNQVISEPTTMDKMIYQLADSLGLSDAQDPIRKQIRSLLCGSSDQKDWDLQKTEMLAAAQCPKGLEDGPCGNSKVDGQCEFGHQACIYSRILRLANKHKHLEALEQAYEPE